MTGMGWPVDLWIFWSIIYVGGFALLSRYFNAKEAAFKREHPDEDYY